MKMSQLLRLAVEQNLLRSLDVQFALMLADDAQPAVMLAAALVSNDAGAGHVCLPLDNLSPQHFFAGRYPELAGQLWRCAGEPTDWAALLHASAAVSNGETPVPLVLNGNRLYLHRMWLNERAVGHFFRHQNQPVEAEPQKLADILHDLFGRSGETDWQKVAAAVALTRRIAVISGGPGTGKTTTVAKLLAAMVLLMPARRLRIQLAAPTGKAAARLTQSLGAALRQLPLNDEQKAQLPEDACTLHRLLGAQPSSQRLRYHAQNRLHLDVLIVDEASMVDLPMMARLIAALPDHARVIFLGDRDQLASVEAGAVLGDICYFASHDFTHERAQYLAAVTGCELVGHESQIASQVRDCLCLLRKSYRFDDKSGIGQLALAVNNSKSQQVRKIFTQGFEDIRHCELNDDLAYLAMINDCVAGYHDYLHLIRQHAPVAEILAAFNRYQLLCALREGKYGVSGLNSRIEYALHQAQLIHCPKGTRWYAGRPVMIVRNDSALGLFNGDIGIALLGEKGLRVWFPMSDGTIKSVQPSRLPQLETAYAMTVHKSQGSEFDHAALVLPDTFVPVVSRELVYTAVTRARRQLSLYADVSVLEKAIKSRTERRSGLTAFFEQAS